MATKWNVMRRIRGVKLDRGLSGIVLAMVFTSACATPSQKSDGPQVIETHSTIETLGTKEHDQPFPSQTEIRVTSWYSDGSRQTRTGLWGWDFNSDGRFDMVEVMGRDGNRAAVVYDFNFDGRVDMTESADGVRKLAGGQPMPLPPDLPKSTQREAKPYWPFSKGDSGLRDHRGRDSGEAPPLLPHEDDSQVPLR